MDHNPLQTPTSKNELIPPAAVPAGIVSPIAFYFGVIIVGLGVALMSVQFGLLDGLTFSLFALWPLILALVPMWQYRFKPSQCVLLFVDIAFLSWFVVFMTGGADSRNALNALGSGVFSSPVLVVLCIIAALMNRRASLVPAVSTIPKATPVAFYLAIVIVVLGTLLLCAHFGFTTGALGIPIAFGPLMLTWIPMWLCCSQRSQGVFMFANFAFACWFLYIYVPMCYSGHVGEFDVLGMIGIGMCSFPVLLVLCIIAVVLHCRDSKPISSPTLYL